MAVQDVSQRARHSWRWLGALAMVAFLTLAACGSADTGNSGVDLGSGQLLAFIGGDGNMWLARADGGNAHAVTATTCPANVVCYAQPAWSPDGQSVAVFGPYKSGNAIYIYNRRGLLQKTIMPVNPLSTGPLLWSGDGRSIGYAGDPAPSGSVSSTPTTPQPQFFLFDPHTGTQLGQIALPAIQSADVDCADTSRGGPLGNLVDHAVNGFAGLRQTLDWSNDGAHVLVSSGQCREHVAVVNHADGQSHELAPLTPKGIVLQAAYAPDGQHIVAMQTTATEDDLLVYDATGTQAQTIYAVTDAPPDFAPRIGSPQWSADGKTIYFSRGVDLWAISADGSNAHKLVSGAATGDPLKAEIGPVPSTDGAHLAWNELTLSNSDNIPRSVLMVSDAQGQNAKIIAQNAFWPAWS